jgi:hypothetical protein
MAQPDQISRIEQLPFVSGTQMIASDMQIAGCRASMPIETPAVLDAGAQPVLADQLVRMQGELFRSKGIDGKGIRIAVLDGGFPPSTPTMRSSICAKAIVSWIHGISPIRPLMSTDGTATV